MQPVQRNTIDKVDGVNDVSERFRHLSAFGISNNGVTVHLLEGHFIGEDDPEEDHTGDPEEKDVPTGFKQT